MRGEDYYWTNIALAILSGVLLTLALEASGDH
jgi:hypothetical protein